MIASSTLLEARWANVRRLARSVGVYLPRWCSRRRRRALVTRVVAALYPPTWRGWDAPAPAPRLDAAVGDRGRR